MARRKKRNGPRPMFGPIFFTLACLFLWAAMITFDAGDWPNPSRYPHNTPTANACGRAGAMVAYQMFYWLGDGAYPLLVFGTLAAGMWLIQGRIVRVGQRAFGLVLLVACTATSVQLLSDGGPNTLAVGSGGVLGAGAGAFLTQTFSGLGSTLVLIYCFIVGLLFAAEGWVLRLPGAAQKVRAVSGDALALARSAVAATLPAPATAGAPAGELDEESAEPPKVAPAPKINGARRTKNKKRAKDENEETLFDQVPVNTPASRKKSAAPPTDAESAPQQEPEAVVEDTVEPPAAQPNEVKVNVARPKPQPAPDPAYPTLIDEWNFPPLDMLHEPESNFTAQLEKAVRAKARLLEQTLDEFRLDARVVEIDTGPVITMFELQLGAGIKVSQIASLSNDVARALKAPAVPRGCTHPWQEHGGN
jgi:S-DNA-T family DNA segregation ATPase FtsK/SpoIIIE